MPSCGVPRKPREQVAGGVYHVFARGNERRLIFRNDADRRTYLGFLSQAIARTNWHCLAYCLMDNHVHLLVETPDPNLALGMQWLQGSYAQIFNRRHQRAGHLFQGRYGAVRVESDAHLFTVVRYLALNPVEANFCDRAEDYSWSSYGGVLATATPGFLDVDRLLGYFAATGGDARGRYRELVSPRSSP
jgi:REP element-mobilizing transposase RayT